MNVDAAVYGRLSGFAGLTALVGSGNSCRVRPVAVPQGDVYPYVTYRVISDLPYHAMSVDAALHRARVQVSSIDDDFNGCRAVDAQVKAALSRFRGTAGGVTVQDIFEDDARDSDDPQDVGNGVFERQRDFIVFYNA